MTLNDGLFNSCAFERAAIEIVEQWFDSIVSRVVRAMYRTTSCTLHNIRSLTRLPLKQVAKSVAVLLQHNLAAFQELPSGQVSYRLVKKHIFYLFRKDKYVYHARSQLDVEAELLLEKVLEEGSATASQLIVATCCRLAERVGPADAAINSLERHVQVRDLLCRLVQRRYLQRCPQVTQVQQVKPAPAADRSATNRDATCVRGSVCDASATTISSSAGGDAPLHTSPRRRRCPAVTPATEEDKYNMPVHLLDLQLLRQEVEKHKDMEKRKDVKKEDRNRLPSRQIFPDAAVAWTLDYDTFHREWRDALLCTSVRATAGPDCAAVLGALLDIAHNAHDKWQSGAFVTAAHVRQALPHAPHLDHCLAVLESECEGGVRRVGSGGGGGEYLVDVATLVRHVTKEFLARHVTETFGSKASRIFRQVMQHHVLSAELVAAGSLLDRREADRLSNTLLLHRYLAVHDLRKGAPAQTGQARDMLFFRVNLLEAVRLTASHCFTALHNLLVKRRLLTVATQALLEKKTRVDAILNITKAGGARPAQIKEVEDMVTPSEREAVILYHKQQNQLLTAVSGITEDVFLLELFLHYHPSMECKILGRRSGA